MNDLLEFGKFIEALRPWHDRIVVVGGWAHRLYRLHPDANSPQYVPVTTRDADIAFSLEKSLDGDIGTSLSQNGFDMEFMGDRTPPVTYYRLGNEDTGFYGEFLVPLIGGTVNRAGKPVPLTVKTAGITAQKLRHLEVLLIEPWPVTLDSISGFGLTSTAQILVPNPVSFLAQKLLIKDKRDSNKQAQDALYIHDTLDLFAPKLDLLRELWLESVRPGLPNRTSVRIEQESQEQFDLVTDVHRNAARIAQDRTIEPLNLQRACNYGLGEIFSPY